MNDEIDEVIAEFLVESYENLDQLDADFIALEETPDDRALLASVFRTIHTIKGTCGFLGFGRLESLTHAGESLLSKLRDGALTLNARRTSGLLAMVDAVRTMLGEIERTGSDGTEARSDLVAELELLATDAGDRVADDSPVEEAEVAATEPAGERRLGEILVDHGDAAESDVTLALAQQHLGDDRRVGEIMVSHGAVAEGAVEDALDRQEPTAEGKSAIADSTIRVDVSRLDRLMNLVGELVLSRNNMLQAVSGSNDRNLTAAAQRLDLITSDLQENLMKTRMQPVGSAWAKMPRIVREVANSCGKRVRLEMVGEETELDKTVIDAIRDPLTHLVRNAIDHGIETPDERATAGKDPIGHLVLKASHESGQVVIEIRDDGAGIDVDQLRAKAVATGALGAEAAQQLAERDAIDLIFLAGFSTAEEVTSVSGRGVGMDVVRTKIDQIGGTVDVTTARGQGSTFTVKLPLTLAIVPALLVQCAGERFAVPEINVVELVQLRRDADDGGIEMLHNAPVYRLRGRLLPLVDLRSILRLGDGRQGETLAVLQADDRQFGLIVDDVVDTQEIVVKPLSRLLSSVPLYAGATIMGDGLVALILDVFRLGQQAHVLDEGAGGSHVDRSEQATDAVSSNTMLLVAAGDRRAALRLEEVTRLEQIGADSVEYRGHQQVVQYRGEIMPLVHLADVMSGAGGYGASSDELTLVVCGRGPHVGLVVDTIIDTVDADAATIAAAEDDTVVLQDRVTEIVDLGRVLAAGGVHPDSSPDDLVGAGATLEGSVI